MASWKCATASLPNTRAINACAGSMSPANKNLVRQNNAHWLWASKYTHLSKVFAIPEMSYSDAVLNKLEFADVTPMMPTIHDTTVINRKAAMLIALGRQILSLLFDTCAVGTTVLMSSSTVYRQLRSTPRGLFIVINFILSLSISSLNSVAIDLQTHHGAVQLRKIGTTSLHNKNMHMLFFEGSNWVNSLAQHFEMSMNSRGLQDKKRPKQWVDVSMSSSVIMMTMEPYSCMVCFTSIEIQNDVAKSCFAGSSPCRIPRALYGRSRCVN